MLLLTSERAGIDGGDGGNVDYDDYDDDDDDDEERRSYARRRCSHIVYRRVYSRYAARVVGYRHSLFII